MTLVIKSSKKALQDFDDAMGYTQNQSAASAEKISREILLRIESLLQYPERYPSDQYKVNNDGSFRPFEAFHYRISYRSLSNEIRIIRIRHTKRNPLRY